MLLDSPVMSNISGAAVHAMSGMVSGGGGGSGTFGGYGSSGGNGGVGGGGTLYNVSLR